MYRQPNSINSMRELIGSGNKSPARSNLFQVAIDPPPVMSSIGGLFHQKDVTGIEFLDKLLGLVGIEDQTTMKRYREHVEMMNFYADTVSIPGRRITVGTVRDVGAMRRFATDTTFSEMQVSFLLPKDMYHREYFERWMNYTASDSENRVGFYDQYTSKVRIIKWELGSNYVGKRKQKQDNGENATAKQRFNGVSACWTMYGAFPFDMSAITLNNGPTDLIKLDISFYYERYRMDTPNNAKMFKGAIEDVVIDMENTQVLDALSIDTGLNNFVGFGL